ncbi:hypothetical protein [uncultured Eubacterium sp.]|uniref:hypothetical protein n=1 Tax=uncultured Eubacterium sp. TaxID=165185 RepID=UPI0015B97774|nr:hypothetical protein [uncultured Eubacterium sp.]
MKINECIDNVSTMVDLKRIASKYLIDYRHLSFDELKESMKLTSPQYYKSEHVVSTLDSLKLNQNSDIRTLYRILIKNIILNKDDYSCLQKTLEDEIIAYEQSVLDLENNEEEIFEQQNLQLLSYVLDVAWENNNDISIDEQNLIYKLKERLSITDTEYELLLAHKGLFPKPKNEKHIREDIIQARKVLQQYGILFVVRDAQGNDHDVIPEEIVYEIRKYYNIDIKYFSYTKLLESKYVRKKAYLISILEKANVPVGKMETLDSLSKKIIERVPAHNLLGGYTIKDGLNGTDLEKWCSDLGIASRGTKPELIDRIIDYYDSIQEIVVSQEDERAMFYEYYEDLAARNLDVLRKQGIIEKDIECERKFEQATNYLFEKMLRNKPLMLKGTEHADGMLAFGNRLILWDNKSKETAVSLSDHIKQFDRYIKAEEKSIPVFMVIGPSFTEDSPKECLKYSMANDTSILLITASELKEVAQKWQEKHVNDEEAFPLGFFKQNGRFDISLVSFN